MKYKVGDKVQIKSLGWYNENKGEDGDISCGEYDFVSSMLGFCGKILTIDVDFEDGTYLMKEDNDGFVFTNEMIERLVERNGKTYPYKIGDKVILKGDNKCATIIDLKYNCQGNLSYYIKIDGDRAVSIDYPTELLLPYDNVTEESVKEKTKFGTALNPIEPKSNANCLMQERIGETKPESKFKIGDRIVTDTNMKGKIIEIVEEGWYRVEFEPHNGIPQPDSVIPEESISFVKEETPKFKIGDKITKGKTQLTILNILFDKYVVEDNFGECSTLYLNTQEGWKLAEEDVIDIDIDEFQDDDEIVDIIDEYVHRLKGSECQIDLPEGYQFTDEIGNVIEAKKIILEKKKKEYPKTYEECSAINGCENRFPLKIIGEFTKLINARNAYWRIAGREMGLGEPWKPDWTNQETPKYCIAGVEGQIKTAERYIVNTILAFPTAEMRDAFYESFKKEIEICKELL